MKPKPKPNTCALRQRIVELEAQLCAERAETARYRAAIQHIDEKVAWCAERVKEMNRSRQ